ncbi:hypothetical protein [Pedobacter steynii]|uniref:Outer membrane protein beta-barrel domain-containing protein n=1 Tax=Pedobacter steynii TaxID=430522 RepID=A0A1D7QID8_9SPHI|nr:hypothetical protein [Pedobacter steynii]AOM78438.1 hypothetical protein BFS30_15385 [Pedobacter steynii]
MNTKRLLIVGLIGTMCMFFTAKSFAQSAKITLSPELLIPFSKAYNVGIGGILEAEWPVEKKLGLTLATGVETLFPKYDDFYSNYTFLPLKGGVKYFVDPKVFINFNLGAAIGFNDYGTSFLVGGGVGYKFNNRIDAGIRIEDAGTSYAALRVGFRL